VQNWNLGAATAFVLLTTASMFVVYRVFTTNREHDLLRRTIASFFAASVLVLLCFSTNWSPGLATLSHRHRAELNARSQLADVIGADKRFSEVRAVVECRKALFVTITGHVETDADLLALRARILRECPDVAHEFLYWRLTVNGSGESYNERDSTIFGDAQKA
jgi:hypothetical protein